MTDVIKNKKILIIAGVVAVVLLLLLSITVQGKNRQVRSQLSLGEKYLLQLEYDQAILAFEKALKIDPKNVRAYIGLADCYIATGEKDKAKEILQRGFDETGDSSLGDYLDRIEGGTSGTGADTSSPNSSSDSNNPTSSQPTTPEKPIERISKLKELTAMEYDYAQDFENGYAFAVKDLKVGYIDKNGTFLQQYTISPEISDNWLEWVGIYIDEKMEYAYSDEVKMNVSEEGLFPFYDEGSKTWGYKNINTGEIVIAPKYERPVPFSEGRAVGTYQKAVEEKPSSGNSEWPNDDVGGGDPLSENRRYEIIDTEGNIIFEPLYVHGRYTDGLIPVTLEKTIGEWNPSYVDRNGNIVINKIQNESAWMNMITLYRSPREGGCFVILQQGGYGDVPFIASKYYTNTGEVIRTFPKDAKVNTPQNGYVCYSNGELLGLETMDGSKQITEAKYKNMSFVYDGVAWVKDANGLYGLIDTTGKEIVPCKYMAVRRPNQGVLAVQDADTKLWGAIKYDGTIVTPFEHEELSMYFQGAYTYKENNKWGYINDKGEKLTEAIYDDAYGPVENRIRVRTGNQQDENFKYGFLKAD